MTTPAQSGRKTQRDRILGLLVDARGGEVPAYELAKVALQYSARVKELRELGFIIRNRTQRVNGQVHGYFRLITGPASWTPASNCSPENKTPVVNRLTSVAPARQMLPLYPRHSNVSDNLFGESLAPDRSYRE